MIEVGSSYLNTTDFRSIHYSTEFPQPPAVFTQPQDIRGDIDDRYLITRQQTSPDTATTEFSVRLQLGNGVDAPAPEAHVGWLAVQTGGKALVAGHTPTVVNTYDYKLDYADAAFDEPPGLLAGMASYNGADSAVLRYSNLTADHATIFLTEDNSDNLHTHEVVDYLLVPGESGFVYSAPIGEYGQVTGVTHERQTVTLQHRYINPVVFATPPSLYGSQPVSVQIDNVTQTGFEIFVKEPANLDNIHAAETVSYFVFEKGSHVLEDGTAIEVGALNTIRLAGQSGGFVPVDFTVPFDAAPAVFSQIQNVSGTESVVSTTFTKTFTPHDDTYVQRGSSAVHGGEPWLKIKKVGANSENSGTRKGIIEFGYNSAGTIDVIDASISLDVYFFSGDRSTAEFYIWGLLDGLVIEDLDEDTANYHTYSPPFADSPDGTNGSVAYLFDADPTQSGAQALGTMHVSDTDLGNRVSFTSPALLDFLRTDTNNRVTILITRQTDDNFLTTSFHSKEAGKPPKLLVEFSMPTYPHTRQSGVSAAKFDLALEDAEGRNDDQFRYGTATVGWLAVERGGTALRAESTPNVTSSGRNIDISNDRFSGTPFVLASVASYADSDPVVPRYSYLDMNTLRLLVQEDTLKDAETDHPGETVDYLVVTGVSEVSESNPNVSYGGLFGGTPLKSYVRSSPTPLLNYDAAADIDADAVWENLAGIAGFDWTLDPGV
ncbi:MAG: hypothetical protein V3V75_02450, partial [Thermoguttaceae bacterium]